MRSLDSLVCHNTTPINAQNHGFHLEFISSFRVFSAKEGEDSDTSGRAVLYAVVTVNAYMTRVLHRPRDPQSYLSPTVVVIEVQSRNRQQRLLSFVGLLAASEE